VCRLTQPGAVQKVLKGGCHVQILIDGEGHAVMQVVKKVIRPQVNRASWVVHGYLKSKGEYSCQGLRFTRGSICERPGRPDLVQGLAGEDCEPAAGFRDQSRQ